MVCCPAMSPVSPVWPRKPKLWAFCVLLLVLLLPWKSWAVEHFQHCHWLVVLNNFDKVGSLPTKARFLDQEPIDTVTELFQKLADLPIDPQEVRELGSRISEGSWASKYQGDPESVYLLTGYFAHLSLQKYMSFPYYLKVSFSCTEQVRVYLVSGMISVISSPRHFQRCFSIQFNTSFFQLCRS